MSPQAQLPRPNYPVLEPEEIIIGCQAIGLQLTDADLKQPTSLLVEKVWEQWSNVFLGTNIEDSNRVALDRLDKMDYPEIYENAMKSRMFYHMISQLTQAAQVPVFTNSDLTAPSSARLVYALSGLINFQLFESEQTEETLAPLLEEKKVMREQEEELERSSKELRERIAAEKAKRLENAPKVQQVRIETTKRKEALDRMKEAAQRLSDQTQDKKSELIQVGNLHNELNKRAMTLSQETNRLKGQVVRSPDKLRQTVVDMRDELARATEELRSNELKAHQLTGKVASLQKYEIDMQSCNVVAKDLSNDVKKLGEGEARMRRLAEELARLESEREELEEKSAILERRVENLKNTLAKFDEKNQYKREQAYIRKKQLQEKLVELQSQKKDIEMQAAEINREAQDVELQIKSIHNETHSILDKSEALYRQMVESVGIYSLQVNNAIDALHAACATSIVI